MISADAMYNYDILSADNSIMIDPNSVEQIRAALEKIRDEQEARQKMAEAAIDSAKDLTIDVRAERIVTFILSKLHKPGRKHEEQ